MTLPTVPASLRERYRREGVWNDRILPFEVHATAKRHPTRLAVADTTGHYTYAELTEHASRLAAALVSRGLKPSDVVAIMMPPRREFLVAFLAVERAGGVVMPLVPTLAAGGLVPALRLGRPRLALTVGRHGRDAPASALVEAAGRVPDALDLGVVALGTELPAGAEPWQRLAEQPDGADLPATLSGDDLAELALTSGTTGEPKGVLHTHNTSLAGIRSTIARQQITDRDVIHVALPVGHNFGYFYGVRLGLAAGATVVLQSRWDVEQMLQLAAHHGVTVSAGTPTHLVDLLEHEQSWEGRLDGLRLYTVAGAPCSPSLAYRALERLPGRLSRAFGMTETGHATATGPGCPPEKVAHTEGRPQPEVQMAILDEDGARLPPGKQGEVAFGGPFNFVGYVQGEAFTRQFLTPDGLFRTGDLGHADDEGYLHLSGRAKDVIIRGGENIPVVEVENALHTYPGLLDVAIVGAPHERLGEVAVACAVVRDGQQVSLEDLQGHLAARSVTRHYWPEALRIVRAIPRNATGKVRRDDLKRMLREGHDHESPG